jgi:hypothetical protein
VFFAHIIECEEHIKSWMNKWRKGAKLRQETEEDISAHGNNSSIYNLIRMEHRINA